MSHEWHRGVLSASSWHGLEEVGVMLGADGMIAHGERSGAWPVALAFDTLRTASGLPAPGRALVAQYQLHAPACLSVVGDRFRATTPDEWRLLIRAATEAGAKPTGAFSLRGGTRVLATFEVGAANGLRTQLLMADAFDGSMRLTVGTTSVRVVCANTLAASMRSEGKDMAKLRHTASLEEKVQVLAGSIGEALQTGERVRGLYHRAEETRLSRDDAERAFDLIFPRAARDADNGAKTRAENERADARRAMALPVNNAGPTLATVWNAATYLVDRKVDGSARPTRGGEALDSMLFGSRADRVEEIQTLIQVIMRDGSVQTMEAPRALEEGVDRGQVGRAILADMLADSH